MKISICEAGPEGPKAPRNQAPKKQPLGLHAGSPPAERRTACLCAQSALVPAGVAQSTAFSPLFAFLGHSYNLEVPASSCSISAEREEAGQPRI